MTGNSVSLKTRLTALVLFAVGMVWAGAVVQTYRDARGEIDEVFDAHLAQSASLLIAQAGDELEEIDIEHAPALHRYSHKVAFQVWRKGTRLLLHSANAPNEVLGPAEAGFSDRTIGGRRWRVFSSWDASGELLVHVGEQAEVRDALAGELVRAVLMPLVLALPLLGVLVWWAVHGGMRPLDSLARQIARRAPDHLEPLEAGRTPAELRPLMDRLNDLFGQVARSLENERRFTADAAHELRTPLAAIRAQAQVALGTADEGERRTVLQKVLEACDRTARLMEQLLTLARLDAPSAFVTEGVALRDLAAQTLAELAPQALDRQIDIGLEDGPQATIQGNPDLLQILLRNLIDNAIRYTPPGGRVSVTIAPSAEFVLLAVSDTGPGIPEAERTRVTDRFYRIAGRDAEGSGLGLSIVARIAVLHGAPLTVRPGPGGAGTTVAVAFPTARP